MHSIHGEFLSPNRAAIPRPKDPNEMDELTIEDLLKLGMTNIKQYLYARKDRRIWVLGETPLHGFMLKIVASSPPELASKALCCEINGGLSAQTFTHIIKAMQHANKELLMENTTALKEVVDMLIQDGKLAKAAEILNQVNLYKNGADV